MRKIKRIIWFQDSFIEEGKLEKKEKEDISSNNDVLEKGEYKDYLEENETQKSYNAFIKLKECIERFMSGRETSNLIGVFGIEAESIIDSVCKEQEFRDIDLLGKIEYGNSDLEDIYNDISAILLGYVKKEFDMRPDIQQYREEIYRELNKIYVSHNTYNEDYEIGLVALSKIALKMERDRRILSVINKINKMKNYVALSNNQRGRFLLIVEVEYLDYKILNKLSKLNSRELIIIVYSLVPDFEIEKDCTHKFFSSSNYIIANQETT